VKGKIEDRMLNELFRQKLENAEVPPAPSVSANLMRRLGRREFLHFSPTRFNIWYAGSIAVAGTVLAIFLSLGSYKNKNERKTEEPVSIEIKNSNVSDNLAVTIPSNQGLNPSENIPGKAEERRKSPSVTTEAGKNEKVNQVISVQGDIISAPSAIVSSLPKNIVIKGASTEKDELKGGINSSENLIEASVTEGCTPLKIRFRNKAGSFDSCVWNFGDGGYSTQKNPEWIFDNAGEYKIILQVSGPDNIKSVSSTVITVHPKPLTKFEFTPEDAIIPDDQIIFHNYSTGAEKYRWDFGDGNSSELFEPLYSYNKSGKYNVRLVAFSEFGCSDSLILYNAFSNSGYFINFPNAFIPNPNGTTGGYYTLKSDEASQVFHPVFSGVSDYQLRIFNRRAIMIFESNDVNIGWDGYYKGQLSDAGVYIWKVRGNFVNGETFTKMGDVTLLKN
jgi:PKD repeat protein